MLVATSQPALPASLARSPLSDTHGRCRALESTVWCFRPPLTLGRRVGHRPPQGSVPSRLPRFPGRPSCISRLSAPALSFAICTLAIPPPCARAPLFLSRCRCQHIVPVPHSSVFPPCPSSSLSSSGNSPSGHTPVAPCCFSLACSRSHPSCSLVGPQPSFPVMCKIPETAPGSCEPVPSEVL